MGFKCLRFGQFSVFIIMTTILLLDFSANNLFEVWSNFSAYDSGTPPLSQIKLIYIISINMVLSAQLFFTSAINRANRQ